MSKTKVDHKALVVQKRKRRQWITFVRMCRYGINNFSRNAWLTIAATAVMTITLLIIFTTLVARNVLLTTVDEIRDKVDISIYVKTDISASDVKTIEEKIKKLNTVKRVTYISPENARQGFAQTNKQDSSALEALNEATNQFPGTFRINIADINNTSQLRDLVSKDATIKKNLHPTRKPSFAGERRSAIENIGKWVGLAEKAGLVASVIFVAISSLIVFNTIRMAIFNRKDEIQMMKLIGADRSFIRGPFVVEAVMYGFIAAVLATGIGVALLYAMSPKLIAAGVGIQQTLDFITIYIALVVLGMVVIGAVIGIISSLLATHKYLKL